MNGATKATIVIVKSLNTPPIPKEWKSKQFQVICEEAGTDHGGSGNKTARLECQCLDLLGLRTFVSTTGEVECQYLGGVLNNSTHKSNPNPSPPSFFSSSREQRNSFHERAPQINEPIVLVMTSGDQLLPFGVFMDSVKKAELFLRPNISTSYICISASYQ